jgi:hypothetical protein
MRKFSLTRLFGLLFILSFVCLGSCKKKETDVCGTNWYSALTNQVTAMTNAAIAYGLNPTTANCSTYKSSLQAYVKALEPYSNCTVWGVGSTKAEWQQALNETKAEINALTCN